MRTTTALQLAGRIYNDMEQKKLAIKTFAIREAYQCPINSCGEYYYSKALMKEHMREAHSH